MGNTEDTSLEQIIEKAKLGNQIAFSSLLDTFWNDVYGFQLIRTKNENDAEDITIQTFSRAFDKIDSYNSSYVFKTWLITISKNIHVDLIRKRKKNVLENSDSGNNEAIKSFGRCPQRGRSFNYRTKFSRSSVIYQKIKAALSASH